ncbi:EthD family reductase [Streptomyces sp900105755]|uniref:EthD family reductase n=1 Tax=Streptomyces sp. 900105755 TaxID=3154389 RepID=A0ABV1TWP8_9ACTN
MTARFIALYETPADPAAFDRHYHAVHIPLVRRLPGPPATRSAATWSPSAARRTAWSPSWNGTRWMNRRPHSRHPRDTPPRPDAAHRQEIAPVRSMIFTGDESVLQAVSAVRVSNEAEEFLPRIVRVAVSGDARPSAGKRPATDARASRRNPSPPGGRSRLRTALRPACPIASQRVPRDDC